MTHTSITRRVTTRMVTVLITAALAAATFCSGSAQARAETPEEMGSLLHADLNLVRYMDAYQEPTGYDGVPGVYAGWSTWFGAFNTTQAGTYMNGASLRFARCSDGSDGIASGGYDWDGDMRYLVSATCSHGDVIAWGFCLVIGDSLSDEPFKWHRPVYWEKFPSAPGMGATAEWAAACSSQE